MDCEGAAKNVSPKKKKKWGAENALLIQTKTWLSATFVLATSYYSDALQCRTQTLRSSAGQAFSDESFNGSLSA
jgi:hypothetical protein